mgnify:CR=1 FL=1
MKNVGNRWITRTKTVNNRCYLPGEEMGKNVGNFHFFISLVNIHLVINIFLKQKSRIPQQGFQTTKPFKINFLKTQKQIFPLSPQPLLLLLFIYI